MTSSQTWNPTGQQFTLTGARDSLTVTEVGATLRELVLNGTQVLETFAEDALPLSAQGNVLVPWPNRVRDGKWTLDGTTQQLDITEPKFGNASHGLLRTQPYALVEQDAASITLAADIHPQRGYPFSLETSIRYALTGGGLEVTHSIANRGTRRAPVGIGTHGYYRIGDVDTDDLTATSTGTTVIDVDDRMNPTGVSGVPPEKDLRAGRAVRELNVDTAYTGLALNEGRYEHSLTASDGRALTVWGDEQFGYVQFYTSDRIRSDGTRSLAIEPMTMPANAFNSGEGLRWIEPGETWTARWGVTFSG
ncbi:aldose 1-epimerase family protein [Paramicrobacterium agarici]|uniref:Aldose 1-epimerase n=1 Tax=Paramicrobacterium agarici TaxID=630514 RepID=A0A2A9DVN5_9MICO|nr:aldose 1-epimerase family protein [Microbacterium agarici]PFG30748.1 aldose 1-epimerase [Microbacterium agarici]